MSVFMFLLDLFVIEIWPICRDLEILYDDIYWSHGMYTLEMYDLYVHAKICFWWWRSVYFLNICFIRVFYRFNRNRALQKLVQISLKPLRVTTFNSHGGWNFQHNAKERDFLVNFNVHLSFRPSIQKNE